MVVGPQPALEQHDFVNFGRGYISLYLCWVSVVNIHSLVWYGNHAMLCYAKHGLCCNNGVEALVITNDFDRTRKIGI